MPSNEGRACTALRITQQYAAAALVVQNGCDSRSAQLAWLPVPRAGKGARRSWFRKLLLLNHDQVCAIPIPSARARHGRQPLLPADRAMATGLSGSAHKRLGPFDEDDRPVARLNKEWQSSKSWATESSSSLKADFESD